MWWLVGAGLALISFFVVVMRRGNHIWRESEFLVALMFVVGGSCVINLDQVTDEVLAHESKRESARAERCQSKLPGLSDRVAAEPSNLSAILELANHQYAYCREGGETDAVASARDHWETIVDIYEAKKEPSETDQDAYFWALNELEASLDWKFNQMVEERCVQVIEAGLDYDQQRERMREFEKCLEGPSNDFENMREELISKMKDIYD